MSDPCAGLGVGFGSPPLQTEPHEQSREKQHDVIANRMEKRKFLMRPVLGWSSKALGVEAMEKKQPGRTDSAGRIIPMDLQTRPWGRGRQGSPR